jgi:hypothetical protein
MQRARILAEMPTLTAESVLVALVVATAAGTGAALAWWSGGPAGRRLEPATPLRILVIAMAVLLVAGSVLLAVGGDVRGPLVVGGAMVATGAGAWLGMRAWGRMDGIPTHVSSSPVRWPVVAAAALVGGLALVSIMARTGIPLLSDDPQGSRGAFGGLVFDVFRWLVPPATLVIFAWALAQPTRRRLACAAVALAGVVGLEVLLASRALPFELAGSALLITWWSGRRLRRSAWLGIGLGAAVLFIGVLLLRMGPEASFRDPLDAFGFIVDRTVGRVVLIQPQTVDVAVETIPDQEPYWAGATYVRRLGQLFGNAADHPPLGSWLYSHLFPGAPPAFAAPGILAEGWVNAGLPLALGLMLALGLGAQGFGRLLATLGPGPADRAAAAAVTVALARTYATSLNGFLLSVAVTAAWWWLVRPGSSDVLRGAIRRLNGARRRSSTTEPVRLRSRQPEPTSRRAQVQTSPR